MWVKRCTRKDFRAMISLVSFCFRPWPHHSLQGGEFACGQLPLKTLNNLGSRRGEKWSDGTRATWSSIFTFRLIYSLKTGRMKKGPVLKTTFISRKERRRRYWCAKWFYFNTLVCNFLCSFCKVWKEVIFNGTKNKLNKKSPLLPKNTI